MFVEQPETFWSLMHNLAHWEFEGFLMFLDNILIGCLIWPRIQKHWNHHIARDKREAAGLCCSPAHDTIPSGLHELIEQARGYKMTEEEKAQQRLSFAYGNARIDNEDVTWLVVKTAAQALKEVEENGGRRSDSALQNR